MTNINIEDCGLSHFTGVNHHLQKEKSFVQREVMKYKANKSRKRGVSIARALSPNIEEGGLGLETEEISRILGQSILNPYRNPSQIILGNPSLKQFHPKTMKICPSSQILPTEVTESYSNLPVISNLKPQSMRNVSPSSTYKMNINRTRERLKKSKKMNSSHMTTRTYSMVPENLIPSSNGLGFMTNSRMQRSLLTDMSVKSGKKKKISNQSTNWNLLNPEILQSAKHDQLSLVHFGKSNAFDRSGRNDHSIMEINSNIQNMQGRNKSRVRKSVMYQYQKIKNLQLNRENLKYSSRHSKSQIEIGFGSEKKKRKKFAKTRNVRKSWNGMTLSRK